MTPLAVAAQQGHIKCVIRLTEAGANIETRDKLQRTPVMHAAKNGHLCVLRYVCVYCLSVPFFKKRDDNFCCGESGYLM